MTCRRGSDVIGWTRDGCGIDRLGGGSGVGKDRNGDADARLWYIYDSDVPGLVGEAPTLEELQEKLGQRVLDMLEGNAHLIHDKTRLKGPHSFRLVAHYEGQQAIAA